MDQNDLRRHQKPQPRAVRGLKRPGYREACEWLAFNDNSAALDLAEIEGSMCLLLVADLFGAEPSKVARAVRRLRVLERKG